MKVKAQSFWGVSDERCKSKIITDGRGKAEERRSALLLTGGHTDERRTACSVVQQQMESAVKFVALKVEICSVETNAF